MMKESLLSLLNQEVEVLKRISESEFIINHHEQDIERVNVTDLSVKAEIINNHKQMILNERNNMDTAESDLVVVRLKIKEYFDYVNSL